MFLDSSIIALLSLTSFFPGICTSLTLEVTGDRQVVVSSSDYKLSALTQTDAGFLEHFLTSMWERKGDEEGERGRGEGERREEGGGRRREEGGERRREEGGERRREEMREG
jgi:hypothetical protein